jgi:hypothetical protein
MIISLFLMQFIIYDKNKKKSVPKVTKVLKVTKVV